MSIVLQIYCKMMIENRQVIVIQYLEGVLRGISTKRMQSTCQIPMIKKKFLYSQV